MVLFNYSTKELTAKVVYYGPGLCGKTTNLQWIHEKLPIRNKGKMLSLATETDRTLFFDFLPIELGSIRGMKTRIQLYTVPGQVFYNATRRMVLKGADGVVFVCDSQESMIDSNLDALENLKENLVINEIDPDTMPIVLQYNKRDLPNAAPLEILNDRLNPKGWPTVEASAIKGVGVEETLKAITAVVFRQLSSKYGGTTPGAPAPAPAPPPRPVAVAPPPPPPPEPEPELALAEPEPMVIAEEPPMSPNGSSTDDLLDEFDTSASPEPPPIDEFDTSASPEPPPIDEFDTSASPEPPMEELQMTSEPELQLEVPAEAPPPMPTDELSLDEELPAEAPNPNATVMADPDATAALRARLSSGVPPPDDDFPMETMEQVPPAAPSFEEPAADVPAAVIEASASAPVQVDADGARADIAIPLSITLMGQTTQVHLTLRLTLDLKLPR